MTSELRIHLFFPCNVMLKLEFSRKSLASDSGKDYSLKCLHRSKSMSQLKYSILLSNHLWQFFSKSKLTIVERRNKVIFFAIKSAGCIKNLLSVEVNSRTFENYSLKMAKIWIKPMNLSFDIWHLMKPVEFN